MTPYDRHFLTTWSFGWRDQKRSYGPVMRIYGLTKAKARRAVHYLLGRYKMPHRSTEDLDWSADRIYAQHHHAEDLN